MGPEGGVAYSGNRRSLTALHNVCPGRGRICSRWGGARGGHSPAPTWLDVTVQDLGGVQCGKTTSDLDQRLTTEFTQKFTQMCIIPYLDPVLPDQLLGQGAF